MLLECDDCGLEYELKIKFSCRDGKFRCKPCGAKKRSKEFKRRNPEKTRIYSREWKKSKKGKEWWATYSERYSKKRKESYYKKTYGIDLKDISDTCDICGFRKNHSKPSSPKNRICVDHDHTTGEVRGFLCNRCNRTLGLIQDDLAILEKMIQYLN